MPDSNFTTGITNIVARAITLIPTSNPKQLFEISVAMKSVTETEDTTVETAVANRCTALLATSLTSTEKQYIARAIGNMMEKDYVDGVDLPTQTANLNKLLKTNGLSLSWVKPNFSEITNTNVTSYTSGKTVQWDQANGTLISANSPTRSFETYANVAGLPGSDTTGKLAYAIAENSFHYWNGSAWQLITITGAPPAASGVLFTSYGQHTWTVPDGVTSVSVVCIGAGGSREYHASFGSKQSTSLGASWFSSTGELLAGCGIANWNGSKGAGGTSSGSLRTGGGNGGASPNQNSLLSGGGGAGGYAQNGGTGWTSNGIQPGGGGVGVYGYDSGVHVRDAGLGGKNDGSNPIIDASGAGGHTYVGHTAGGWSIRPGGYFGGGAGGDNRGNTTNVGGGGGALAYANGVSVTSGSNITIQVGSQDGRDVQDWSPGAVRIIWGDTREFPNTNCKLADSTAGETTV